MSGTLIPFSLFTLAIISVIANPFPSKDQAVNRLKLPIADLNVNPPLSKFIPIVSEECKAVGICDDALNYPYDHVEKHLSKPLMRRQHFHMDVLNREHTTNYSKKPVHFETCHSIELIIYPFAAKNSDGNWLFILNRKNNPIQGYYSEKCRDENQPCNFYREVNTTCSMNYMTVAMWALNFTGYPILDNFSVSYCCNCFLV